MAQLGDTIILGNLSTTGTIYGNLSGTATNATCFDGCTYADACTDIRSGLCSHDCLVNHKALTSTSSACDRNILVMGAGFVDGCICPIYFNNVSGKALTYNSCCGTLKVGPIVSCTSSVAGKAGVTVGLGSMEMSASTPYIDFHKNNYCGDYSTRIIDNSSGLQICINNGTGCTASTASAVYTFDATSFYTQKITTRLPSASTSCPLTLIARCCNASAPTINCAILQPTGCLDVKYLRLGCAGATESAGLIFARGNKSTACVICFLNNTNDANGNGYSIGAGGIGILGAGESANSTWCLINGSTNLFGACAGKENLYLTADGCIIFWSNMNTPANKCENYIGTDGYYHGNVCGNVCGQAKTALCSTCAYTVCITNYGASCDRPLVLTCGSATYESIGKSCCYPITFNPANGQLILPHMDSDNDSSCTIISYGGICSYDCDGLNNFTLSGCNGSIELSDANGTIICRGGNYNEPMFLGQVEYACCASEIDMYYQHSSDTECIFDLLFTYGDCKIYHSNGISMYLYKEGNLYKCCVDFDDALLNTADLCANCLCANCLCNNIITNLIGTVTYNYCEDINFELKCVYNSGTLVSPIWSTCKRCIKLCGENGIISSFGSLTCMVSKNISFSANTISYVCLGYFYGKFCANELQIGFTVSGSNVVNSGVLKIIPTSAKLSQSLIELKISNYTNTSYGIIGVGLVGNDSCWNCFVDVYLKICNAHATCNYTWTVGIYKNQVDESWSDVICCVNTTPAFTCEITIPTSCRNFYYNNAYTCIPKLYGTLCGNVSGTLTGTATLVCRYTINSGEQHVALLANNTATSGVCVRVSNGCTLKFNPSTGLLCAKTLCGNLCGFSQYVTKNAFSSASTLWDVPLWTSNATNTCLGANSKLQFCLDTNNCGHLITDCFEGKVTTSDTANNIIAYSDCASGCIVKCATLNGFSLENGQRILFYLANKNCVANACLNVNGTGDKAIKINGTTSVTASNLSNGYYMANYVVNSNVGCWYLYPILNLNSSLTFNGTCNAITTNANFGAIGVKAWYITCNFGYMMFVNRLLVQWGAVTPTYYGDDYYTISLPLSYATTCYTILALADTMGGGPSYGRYVSSSYRTKQSFRWSWLFDQNLSRGFPLNYLTIGYAD